MSKLKPVLYFAISLAFLEGCSSTDIIDSKWTDEPVPLDISYDEWRGQTFYVADKSLMIGVKNDNDYLYVALITGDRSNKMQILGRGLTIWFDKEGGKDKIFGIKFPSGSMGSSIMFRKENDANDDNKIDVISQMVDKAQSETEIQILGPGENDRQMVSLVENKNVFPKIGIVNDVLIYELKIALRTNSDNRIAIGVNNTNNIGIGFETAEFERKKTEDQGKRRDNGEGNEGRGNRQRGNRGPGMNKEAPQQLQYWCNVTLASHTNNTTKK